LGKVLMNLKTQFMHKGIKLNLLLEIKIEGDSIPNKIIGDEQNLFSIINSLLENAAKFCRNMPRAELTIRLLKKTPQIMVNTGLSPSAANRTTPPGSTSTQFPL